MKYRALPDLNAHLAKMSKEDDARKAAAVAKNDDCMTSEIVNVQDTAEIVAR